MNHYQRKYHGQIEITDLVAEAVSNAAARRNQVLDSEEPLSPLSAEQAGAVTGGQVPPDLIAMGYRHRDSGGVVA
jgi:hypothetical protein